MKEREREKCTRLERRELDKNLEREKERNQIYFENFPRLSALPHNPLINHPLENLLFFSSGGGVKIRLSA